MRSSVGMAAVLALVVGGLYGCATPKYSCPLPEDAGKCMSISDGLKEINKRSAQSQPKPDKKAEEAKPAIDGGPGQYTPGQPIWRDARKLGIWFTPYVDRARNWHDQSYVVVLVDKGAWLIRENRRELDPTKTFRNLQPPRPPATSGNSKPAPSVDSQEDAEPSRDQIKDAAEEVVNSTMKR